MKNELRGVLRVRELRARLAQNEALRTRHALERAANVVGEARRRKDDHELRAAAAAALASSAVHSDAAPVLLAAEAHRLLDFAAGERCKAREGAALIRRAELVMQRAQEEADASAAEYRALQIRSEAVRLQSRRQQQTTFVRRREREEETCAEEHATHAAARSMGNGEKV